MRWKFKVSNELYLGVTQSHGYIVGAVRIVFGLSGLEWKELLYAYQRFGWKEWHTCVRLSYTKYHLDISD